jgi:hypothetical protein
MPNGGAKFIELIAGARFAGGAGGVGAVGGGVEEDEPEPPPQAAVRPNETRHANANTLRIEALPEWLNDIPPTIRRGR